MFVAVGENSQYLAQLSCFFNVYWSLLSTVDQTLTSLSSPHVDSKSPSQLNPMDLILALWALINETSLALLSKSTSQNLSDSSLDAETNKLPLGLNFKSWIWFLCPVNLLGGTCRLISHSKMTLSIPALAIYLQEGCKSKHMMDYLWLLSDLIKHGSSYDCIFVIDFLKFLVL